MKKIIILIFAIVFLFITHCKSQETLQTKDSIPKKQDNTKERTKMTFVEEMAEPFEGYNSIQMFIQDNLIYPEEAKSKGISGKVFIEFVIEEDGTITNIKVLVGVHPLLDEEAMRVVGMFPKWKPCKNKGKPVRCYYQLPVTF